MALNAEKQTPLARDMHFALKVLPDDSCCISIAVRLYGGWLIVKRLSQSTSRPQSYHCETIITKEGKIMPTPYFGSRAILSMAKADDGRAIIGIMRYPNNGSSRRTPTEEEMEAAAVSASKARTRRTIREKSLANEFEYFATFTFSPERLDPTSTKFIYPAKVTKSFQNHFRYLHRKLTYLMVVVENTDSGLWHIHGLLRGIPEDELYLLAADTPGITEDQKKRILKGEVIYKWKLFDKLYGSHHELVRLNTTDIYGEIISQQGKTTYMTKQYDKLDAADYQKFRYRRVMSSRNLKTALHESGFISDVAMLDLAKCFDIGIGPFGGTAILDAASAAAFEKALHNNRTYQMNICIDPYTGEVR